MSTKLSYFRKLIDRLKLVENYTKSFAIYFKRLLSFRNLDNRDFIISFYCIEMIYNNLESFYECKQ